MAWQKLPDATVSTMSQLGSRAQEIVYGNMIGSMPLSSAYATAIASMRCEKRSLVRHENTIGHC